jgi:hypothetical protein
VLEKQVEAYLIKRVKELDGKAYKFTSPAHRGVADRIVHPRKQVLALWEHWGRPDIGWYRGGHTGFFESRPVQRYVDAAVFQSGLGDAGDQPKGKGTPKG